MNRVTMFTDYMATELSKAEIDQVEAETIYDQYCARLYLTTKEKNKQKAILADQKANELLFQLNVATAKSKMLKALVEGKDRQYRALSRDQTRRQVYAEKKRGF